MFHTRVVGAKTLEQLLLGEDLPTAGIGGYVSYVGRRSRRRQSKANQRFRSYPIDDDAGSRFPAFEVMQSGNEIKVKLLDAATGIVTPAADTLDYP
jgi:hypothetical protein